MNTLEPMPSSSAVRRRAPLFLLLILVLCVGLFIGRYIVPSGSQPLGPLQFVSVNEGQRELIFPTFWEAWDVLHSKFIGNLEMEKLYYGAVEGMIRASGDPYTVFSDPQATKQFEEALSGSFSGVGIEIGLQNGLVTVIAPLKDSPADKAGIQTGDIIVAVDEMTITPEMSLDEIVRKIRGPKGSTVQLTVLHKDSRETNEIKVTRDTIEVESVLIEYKDDLAHVTITNFKDDTARRFNTISQELVNKKVKGIVLDVRNNPGGFLQSSVEIGSQFVAPGSVIVSERGKSTHEYKSSGPHLLKDIPVVVLINGGSASASEILAGALQDLRSVPVIGTKSFGKGSVQEFVKLKDGSGLRVTIAKWYTPSGRSIHEHGIDPTIEVKDDREAEGDEQLNRAYQELKPVPN